MTDELKTLKDLLLQKIIENENCKLKGYEDAQKIFSSAVQNLREKILEFWMNAFQYDYYRGKEKINYIFKSEIGEELSNHNGKKNHTNKKQVF